MEYPAPEDPHTRHAFYHERTVAADRDDVDFYVSLARQATGPVLEMACGTGRITLSMLAAGVDVDGFDRSASALAVLRRLASEELNATPSVWQADMRHFATTRAYDLVVCPFNAFQYLRTVEDQLAALECAYGALRPGGRLRFDVFVPGFEYICESYGEWQTETVTFRGETHTFRTLTTVVDEVAQDIRVERELLAPDGACVFREAFHPTLLPKPAVELLARLSPFESWTVTGDYSDQQLSDGDDVQVWTMRKAPL